MHLPSLFHSVPPERYINRPSGAVLRVKAQITLLHCTGLIDDACSWMPQISIELKTILQTKALPTVSMSADKAHKPNRASHIAGGSA
jgi:hypothetical protein